MKATWQAKGYKLRASSFDNTFYYQTKRASFFENDALIFLSLANSYKLDNPRLLAALVT